MFYFFRRYLRTNKAVTSWTKRSTFRTLYGATSEIIHLLCTVTFVMNIYVMIVRLNILQINPKTTRWFHLKGGAIYFFSRVYKTLQKKLVNGIVNNVAFHFAHSVFPLISIQTTKTLTFWKTLKKRKKI